MTMLPASSDPGPMRDNHRGAEEIWKESKPSMDMMLYRMMINKQGMTFFIPQDEEIFSLGKFWIDVCTIEFFLNDEPREHFGQ